MTNQTSPAAHRLDAFYRALRRPGITRPKQDRWFAGVAAGVANRAGVDPMVVRIGFVLAAMFLGAGVAAYLVLWLLLPAQDGTLRIERALKDGDVPSVVLLVLAAISAFGPGAPFWGGFHGFHLFGLVAFVAVAAWFLNQHRSGGHRSGSQHQSGTSGHMSAPSDQSTDAWRVEPTSPVPDDAPRPGTDDPRG
jgi:phage shock protein PspC (stress-responsive transcriptional regulator)